MPLHIVLVEPEIPQNTGNIARTCAVTGAVLHLVKPLGFSVEDRYLKRAGLDYWHMLEIYYHDSIDDFFRSYPNGDFFFLHYQRKSCIYRGTLYRKQCYFLWQGNGRAAGFLIEKIQGEINTHTYERRCPIPELVQFCCYCFV
jgi:tRNA (cytidine/uridine-2'-O-)-methyltransferase